jgi:Domain of unknown function (DUF4386)
MATQFSLSTSKLSSVQRIGIGSAFVLTPLAFLFAFAVHPNLLAPQMLSSQALILRAHHNALLDLGHVVVLFSVPLLIVIALEFMRLLRQSSSAWVGFIGGILAIIGAVILAADKGAFCLTMSALDTIPDSQFEQMMPGLVAIFSKQGAMAITWGIIAISVGFICQSIALFRTKLIPRWQCIFFLLGVILVGTPDGLEIVNLSASLLMAAALIPYGIQCIRTKELAS